MKVPGRITAGEGLYLCGSTAACQCSVVCEKRRRAQPVICPDHSKLRSEEESVVIEKTPSYAADSLACQAAGCRVPVL